MSIPALPKPKVTLGLRTAKLPAVPALKGETYPEGFSPLDDEIVLKRTITVSANVRVVGSASTGIGDTTIEIDCYGKRGYATVAAMNFLKRWLESEIARLTIKEQPVDEVVDIGVVGKDDEPSEALED